MKKMGSISTKIGSKQTLKIEMQVKSRQSLSVDALKRILAEAREEGKLDLSNQGIENYEKEVHEYITEKSLFQLITILNLSHNRLGTISGSLCQSLSSTLTELHLAENRLESLPDELFKVIKHIFFVLKERKLLLVVRLTKMFNTRKDGNFKNFGCKEEPVDETVRFN